MKTSVFIFLFLLVSSLSSVMDSGAKSGVPAAAAVRQTAECFLAGFKYGDCVATETVRTLSRAGTAQAGGKPAAGIGRRP